MNIERRFIPIEGAKIETRAGDDGEEKKVITGYGAVFYDGSEGSEFAIYSDWKERIDPKAFDNVMTDDVRALFNHDVNHVLGRSKSGTLKMSIDNRGLKYEIDVPNTSTGKDVLENIRLGNITGSSFSFHVKTEEYTDNPDGTVIRTIKEIAKLYDVGPVTFPAYEATEASARSSESVKEEYEKRKDEQEKAKRASINRKQKRAWAIERGL